MDVLGKGLRAAWDLAVGNLRLRKRGLQDYEIKPIELVTGFDASERVVVALAVNFGSCAFGNTHPTVNILILSIACAFLLPTPVAAQLNSLYRCWKHDREKKKETPKPA